MQWRIALRSSDWYCMELALRSLILSADIIPQGVPPATVAEWTLQADGNRDFYDGKVLLYVFMVINYVLLVSLVDGYNLPMRIDNNKGCSIAECPVDLGLNCLFLVSTTIW